MWDVLGPGRRGSNQGTRAGEKYECSGKPGHGEPCTRHVSWSHWHQPVPSFPSRGCFSSPHSSPETSSISSHLLSGELLPYKVLLVLRFCLSLWGALTGRRQLAKSHPRAHHAQKMLPQQEGCSCLKWEWWEDGDGASSSGKRPKQGQTTGFLPGRWSPPGCP